MDRSMQKVNRHMSSFTVQDNNNDWSTATDFHACLDDSEEPEVPIAHVNSPWSKFTTNDTNHDVDTHRSRRPQLDNHWADFSTGTLDEDEDEEISLTAKPINSHWGKRVASNRKTNNHWSTLDDMDLDRQDRDFSTITLTANDPPAVPFTGAGAVAVTGTHPKQTKPPKTRNSKTEGEGPNHTNLNYKKGQPDIWKMKKPPMPMPTFMAKYRPPVHYGPMLLPAPTHVTFATATGKRNCCPPSPLRYAIAVDSELP